VTIIDTAEGLFLDYGKLLNTHYNSFKTGIIQKNHIFRCDVCDDTEMNMNRRTHDGADEVIQPILKRDVKRSEEPLHAISAFKMETLKPPGLRTVKQVELFNFFDRMCLVNTVPKSARNRLRKSWIW
jgi:hypothetical protein